MEPMTTPPERLADSDSDAGDTGDTEDLDDLLATARRNDTAEVSVPRLPDVRITVAIDNIYPGGTVKTTWSGPVPAPATPADLEDTGGWAYDHIFDKTGTGRTQGNSAYFVNVTDSSDPETIPVGYEWEWGT